MVIFSFPTSRFSRRGENKNLTTSAKPQVGNENIAMTDEWGILPIPTSPQMRINVKMKCFDFFLFY
jgi:hypothetical protein